MTAPQHKYFYLPAWTACSRACQWNTQAGIWGPGRTVEGAEDAGRLAQVMTYAKQLAGREHRGPRSDDFRHACHIAALGQNKSSLDLTNKEVTRVACLFKVLADPLNIDAQLDWADPERAEKRNLIAAVKAKAPEAYWRAISKGRFHTTHLDDLSLRQLQSLCFTLNQRKASWAKPVSREGTKENQYAEGPF